MSHHLLTLNPTDVLFFKDGRPMEGASSGHGSAWPLPHVLDAALHHALRRAEHVDFEPRRHPMRRSGRILNKGGSSKGREFGALKTVGPFPVKKEQQEAWYFPRPADAAMQGNFIVTHRPLLESAAGGTHSLGQNLAPVVNSLPPTKAKPEPWFDLEAWSAYVQNSQDGGSTPKQGKFAQDTDFFSSEYQIGIGIDPETDAQNQRDLYSASYLRLRPAASMGLIASCLEKTHERDEEIDVLEKTFLNSGHENFILVGGQQRTCSVYRNHAKSLPLPKGQIRDFTEHQGRYLVKWVLLSPAIYPQVNDHPGGWMPSWIDHRTMEVQLLDGPGKNAAQRRGLLPGKRIDAKLVAAITTKPLPVTGWALTRVNDNNSELEEVGGARSTHLAVPAGSVYYFSCSSEEAALKLASALNWHGDNLQSTKILNRRSTLLGEKGYGIGVCASWNPLQ